ncbi:MAG TPA: endonuclease/exonuclease/phosphatase family protein [Phycisphaerae bacterium]|nr:endonuclease/exonuclease/phosphatase family protein [Phycisphaerae bacterium]
MTGRLGAKLILIFVLIVILLASVWLVSRLSPPLAKPPSVPEKPFLTIMTANIRLYGTEPTSTDQWPLRRALLVQTLLKYHPMIIALQGAGPAQNAYLVEHLNAYDHYPGRSILHGNLLTTLASALTTWNQIYYLRDRFILIDSANGLVLPREPQANPTENTYYSLVVLQDRYKELPDIIIIDTHIRHLTISSMDASKQLQVILRDIYWRKYPDALAVLVGDMNHEFTYPPVYDLLVGKPYVGSRYGMLQDTFVYDDQHPGESWGTHHSFTGLAELMEPSDLFLVSQGWSFDPPQIIRDHMPDGRYPSDHFFVLDTLYPSGPPFVSAVHQ